jgi:undecaprenyl-diphosphatase
MSWWQGLLLGVLQGFTEFLPVSSSGHLALAQMAFDRMGLAFHQPGVVFDAMLHVGTAVAVIWSERRQLRRWLTTAEGQRLLGLLVLGTLATAVVAFPLKDLATAAFDQPVVVGGCLILTGLVVFSTRIFGRGHLRESTTTWKHAALIGLIQGLAVFPGMSRSGATITAGLGTGLDRTWAARFSFLLSVPAIAGATLVELISNREALNAVGMNFWFPTLIGAIAAAVTGFVALRLVIRLVSSSVFDRFAWYCLPLGVTVMVLAFKGIL